MTLPELIPATDEPPPTDAECAWLDAARDSLSRALRKAEAEHNREYLRENPPPEDARDLWVRFKFDTEIPRRVGPLLECAEE